MFAYVMIDCVYIVHGEINSNSDRDLLMHIICNVRVCIVYMKRVHIVVGLRLRLTRNVFAIFFCELIDRLPVITTHASFARHYNAHAYRKTDTTCELGAFVRCTSRHVWCVFAQQVRSIRYELLRWTEAHTCTVRYHCGKNRQPCCCSEFKSVRIERMKKLNE